MVGTSVVLFVLLPKLSILSDVKGYLTPRSATVKFTWSSHRWLPVGVPHGRLLQRRQNLECRVSPDFGRLFEVESHLLLFEQFSGFAENFKFLFHLFQFFAHFFLHLLSEMFEVDDYRVEKSSGFNIDVVENVTKLLNHLEM